jgi:hypothetical protein
VSAMCDEATLARALDELAQSRRDMESILAVLARMDGELIEMRRALDQRHQETKRGLGQVYSALDRKR